MIIAEMVVMGEGHRKVVKCCAEMYLGFFRIRVFSIAKFYRHIYGDLVIFAYVLFSIPISSDYPSYAMAS